MAQQDWDCFAIHNLVSIGSFTFLATLLLTIPVSWIVDDIYGIDLLHLPPILTAAAILLCWASIIRHEFHSRVTHSLLRKSVLPRDDFVVELQKIAACKFARDIDHGQYIFFVKTTSGEVIFVFEGQDVLDEDWEENPLQIQDSHRPKSELKIVRVPETRESILLEFHGSEVPINECFSISVDFSALPRSGDIINASWDDLEKRYGLSKMNVA